MKVVFMGTPEFAVAPLKGIFLSGHEVVAVYTQPDKPAGRGRLVVESPVKKEATILRLPVLQPRNFKAQETVAELRDFKPEAIVVAAFGQMLPQSVLDIPRYGCINIHPSLLPKYRGVSPVAAAILVGDEFTGVSVMLLDSGTDTGPVLVQAQVPISPHDTTGSLTEKLSRIGTQLLVDVLPRWVKGQVAPRPQEEAKASYSGKVTKEDGQIDWRLSALVISRRVRAFNPWPGAYTAWHGKQLKIVEARPLPARDAANAGLVVSVPDGLGFGIGTGDGTLGVVTVQLQGKKAMPAADFLRGQRGLVGAVLPS